MPCPFISPSLEHIAPHPLPISLLSELLTLSKLKLLTTDYTPQRWSPNALRLTFRTRHHLEDASLKAGLLKDCLMSPSGKV